MLPFTVLSQAPKVRCNLAGGGVCGAPGLDRQDFDKPQRGEVNDYYDAALRLALLCLAAFQGLRRLRPWLNYYAPSVLWDQENLEATVIKDGFHKLEDVFKK